MRVSVVSMSPAMLAALIDGERDVRVLAEMAKAWMRSKISQLTEALTGGLRRPPGGVRWAPRFGEAGSVGVAMS